MAKPDRLIYLALGGAGEIGMNMYLYGYGPEGAERFILVDMGVSFPTMEIDAGGRADHGRSGLDPGPRRPAGGDLHHPRPRGPSRRARPALAPAAGAGLCPPLHRGAGQGQDGARRAVDRRGAPGRRPGRTWCRPARSASASCRSRIRSRRARRWSSTRRRGGSCIPATSRPTRRRWSASRSTPQAFRALGDAGVKVLACDSTNVFNAHAGRSEATLIEPIGALDARGRGHGGRHHLRLERGAAEDAGAGRARCRAAGGGARPGDEHDAEDRACGGGARRLSAGARSARRRQRAAAATCWCSRPAARASAAPPRRSWRRASIWASS